MKQIKFYLTITLFLTAFITNAQIKVHSDGQVSLGSLTTTYGVQIQPNGCTSFKRSTNPDWSWITIAQTLNPKSKCWIIKNDTITNNTPQTFYVLGSGLIYTNAGMVINSDSRFQQTLSEIENPTETLGHISGFYYNYTDNGAKGDENKRAVGFSAQEIEKVLPEAVETDENGIMYINYESLTVFLVEAVKEQQKEIENLRSILKDNGLLK